MHRTIHAFLPGMLKKGSGSIVNIASGASSVRGIPNRYVYGASKAAVVGLTKRSPPTSSRKASARNAIAPGTIESPSLDDRIETLAKEYRPIRADRAAGFRRPPGDGPARHRAGSRQARVFLASDEASYVTGQVHLVDGGFAL